MELRRLICQLNEKLRLVIDEGQRRSDQLEDVDINIYSDLSSYDWSTTRIEQFSSGSLKTMKGWLYASSSRSLQLAMNHRAVFWKSLI